MEGHSLCGQKKAVQFEFWLEQRREESDITSKREHIQWSKRGQVIVEYVVIAGLLLASLAILSLFLNTFQEYSYRILEMVGSDYP